MADSPWPRARNDRFWPLAAAPCAKASGWADAFAWGGGGVVLTVWGECSAYVRKRSRLTLARSCRSARSMVNPARSMAAPVSRPEPSAAAAPTETRPRLLGPVCVADGLVTEPPAASAALVLSVTMAPGPCVPWQTLPPEGRRWRRERVRACAGDQRRRPSWLGRTLRCRGSSRARGAAIPGWPSRTGWGRR